LFQRLSGKRDRGDRAGACQKNPSQVAAPYSETLDVKVNSFRDLFQIPRSLKPQAEHGDGHGSGGYNPDQDKQQTTGHPDAEQAPVSQDASAAGLSPEQEKQAVEKAVFDFQTESKSQQHGLQANLSPGLKVVLSDINGNVIRQFEAAEFLKLRTGGKQDTRGRGKLLDQKY